MKITLTSDRARQLLLEQLKVWEQAQLNFEALTKKQSKEFYFDGFSIKVQFNPGRLKSSAAKVDTQSIQERKCFLCSVNLPAEQRGISYEDKYQLLVNPFPIFPEHFTIPTNDHVDQLILKRYEDMLDLAKCLDKYTLFYNGPKCGASAPDHAHFQAGTRNFMPVEKDVQNICNCPIIEVDSVLIYSVENYLRNGLLIEAKDKKQSVEFFEKIYSLLDVKEGEQEPMMNVVAWYENDTWFTCIFPRVKHRPSCFYAEGDDNLLISPASVDLGGVLIATLEKDFNKITSKDIQSIFNEICINDADMQLLIDKVRNLKLN